MGGDRQRRAFAALAELLSYPRGDLGALAARAAALAGAGSAPADALGRFAAAIGALPGGAVEELYTGTFDLEPVCAPYLGVQLLGDDPRRGLFLARLAELYARDGFAPGRELADHVAEVFAFLAVARSTPERDDLVGDALLPALERMAAALAERSNPYREVLVAARALAMPAGVPAGGVAPEVLP